MNEIERTKGGYMIRRASGCTSSAPAWGGTLSIALWRHYAGDTRRIPRSEQARVAREYRARCAEEDAKKDRSVST